MRIIYSDNRADIIFASHNFDLLVEKAYNCFPGCDWVLGYPDGDRFTKAECDSYL